MPEAFEFHVIGELRGIDRSLLVDPEFVYNALVRAVTESGLTLFDVYVHRRGNGVLGVAVIGESHVAVHTWPEHNLVTVEVSSCKDPESTWEVFMILRDLFGAESYNALDLRSGIALVERLKGAAGTTS
ncbi:MAG TPA: adenosylmethionine decarboxylase [Candidatus Korarchaeota archaeon]|nr:adenosylmethionine decarboxylase [Candidatus Korarchaeota archaeon]